jgi:hypothetical protein
MPTPERTTPMRVSCEDEICTQCQGIVTRTYRELVDAGDSDRDAYLSAVRVLELRHPGHVRDYYFL